MMPLDTREKLKRNCIVCFKYEAKEEKVLTCM